MEHPEYNFDPSIPDIVVFPGSGKEAEGAQLGFITHYLNDAGSAGVYKDYLGYSHNCAAVTIYIDPCPFPLCILVATKNIEPDEELFWPYSKTYWQNLGFPCTVDHFQSLRETEYTQIADGAPVKENNVFHWFREADRLVDEYCDKTSKGEPASLSNLDSAMDLYRELKTWFKVSASVYASAKTVAAFFKDEIKTIAKTIADEKIKAGRAARMIARTIEAAKITAATKLITDQPAKTPGAPCKISHFKNLRHSNYSRISKHTEVDADNEVFRLFNRADTLFDQWYDGVFTDELTPLSCLSEAMRLYQILAAKFKASSTEHAAIKVAHFFQKEVEAVAIEIEAEKKKIRATRKELKKPTRGGKKRAREEGEPHDGMAAEAYTFLIYASDIDICTPEIKMGEIGVR